MSARRGGSLATVLLLIPLAAIPFMALFGIPEFDQLSASTEEFIPDIVRQPSLSFVDDAGERSAATDQNRDRASDLLAPINGETANPTAAPDSLAWSHNADNSEQATAAAAWNVDSTPGPSPRPTPTSAAVSLADRPEHLEAFVAPQKTESGLSWREATRRLKELGISDYHLNNVSGVERFLFVCHISPGGDSRIIQRFEAEADDPLVAVEDVLGQVDGWLQHRFAKSRQWLP